jgi:hypothetical protein
LGMTCLPIQIRERYTRSVGVGSTHVFRTPQANGAARAGKLQSPYGLPPFPRAPFVYYSSECSDNAGTQVFD